MSKKKTTEEKKKYAVDKSFLQAVFRLWPTSTVEEIAKELGFPVQRIFLAARVLRQAGAEMAKKRAERVSMTTMAKEVIAEAK